MGSPVNEFRREVPANRTVPLTGTECISLRIEGSVKVSPSVKTSKFWEENADIKVRVFSSTQSEANKLHLKRQIKFKLFSLIER